MAALHSLQLQWNRLREVEVRSVSRLSESHQLESFLIRDKCPARGMHHVSQSRQLARPLQAENQTHRG